MWRGAENTGTHPARAPRQFLTAGGGAPLRRRLAKRGSGGFTLIELTMVILIISIATAVVVPQLMDIGETRARGAMRKFQGTVKYLFNETIFRKRSFQLKFDLSKGEYWVEVPKVENAIAGQQVESIELKDSFIGKRGEFPKGMKILDVQSPRLGKKSDGEVTIHFFPNGSVEPATIHFEDQNKKQFTLFIQPLTGTVKVLPGYVEITRNTES
jgi:general secretion pathway protein H